MGKRYILALYLFALPQLLMGEEEIFQIDTSKGIQRVDLPVVLNADTTLHLPRGMSLIFGPEASMSTPQTVTVRGLGDLINESRAGFSPARLILEEGTITNRDEAVFAQNIRLLQIKGGTFINGDLNADRGADAAREAELIEMKGGTIVNERSHFGTAASHFDMRGGTVVNRGDAYLCSLASLFEMHGGTTINDGSHLGVQNEGRAGDVVVHRGTMINQNKATLGSHYTNITLNDGIIINSKDSQMISANFQINGGTLINDGVISIVEYDSFLQMHKGVVTGTGSFVSVEPEYAFTFRNTDVVIPGTIALSAPELAQTYQASEEEDKATFVQDVIETNGYGQLEMPVLQFIPGTLMLAGNGTYEQTESGTLMINIEDKETHSQIVAANATLNGTLQLNALSHFDVQPGETLTILESTNGISGTFSHVQGLNLPSLIPTVVYLQDSVTVTFSPTLRSYIGGMSQTIFTAVNNLNIRLDRQMERVRDRFFNAGLERTVALASLLADNENERLLREPEEKQKRYPWNVYIAPLGSVGEVNSRTNQRRLSYWSGGVLAGFDYAWSDVGLGFSLEYQRIGGTASENWGHFNIDHVQASLYTTYAPKWLPSLAINGIIGGGIECYHIDRNTGTFSVKKVAHGSPHGGEFDTLFGVEYTFSHKQLNWTPMASLQYIYFSMGGYKERGADLYDLKISHQNANSLRSLLGIKLDYRLDWKDFSFTPQIDAAWQREFLDSNRSIHFAPLNVPGPAGSLSIFGAGRNTALIGADLLFSWYHRFDLDVSYDYEWNSLFQDHFFYLGFNMQF